MKPDSRYTCIASIGFNLPQHELDQREYRTKYGCSKGISKNENLILSLHKCVSLGKVKSYGSITTIINSLGQGA